MPKRSNDFQQLVKHIYSQMVPKGASVQESVLLKERSSTSMREVDILIEYEFAGHKFRTAVECRDRSRRNDVGWIDRIIGKYKDLNVDKVFAVSRSGFSGPAKEKALANKIKTITLERALNLNWPQEFIKPGVATLILNTKSGRFHIKATPSLTEKPQRSDKLIDGTRKAITTIGEVVDYLYPKAKNEIGVYLNQHHFNLFHTLSDLRKPFKTEQSFPISSPLYLIDSNGVSHKIESIILTTISKFSVKKAPVEHYTFGDGKALVTTGVLDFAEENKAHTVNIIQIPRKKQMAISVKSFKKKKTRT